MATVGVHDLGKVFPNHLDSDVSAVLGIIQRQGLGKLGHIDCTLFVQRLNTDMVLPFAKVPWKDNPADLWTKVLMWDVVKQHVSMVGAEFANGRPSLCPKVLWVGRALHVPPEGGAQTRDHGLCGGACVVCCVLVSTKANPLRVWLKRCCS